jgi:hypothetical protein
MQNLHKYLPPQVLEFWNKGQVSFTEAVSYVLWQLVELWQQGQAHHDRLMALEQAQLNLTLYQLKADVDSPMPQTK